MKILFLDIDGILNCDSFYERISVEERNESREKLNDEWGEMFDPIAIKNINTLIEKTSAKVVITSTKRITKFIKESYEANLKYIQEMWINRGFIGEVIGTTPHFSINYKSYAHINQFKEYEHTISRGEEINTFLRKNYNYRTLFFSEEDEQEYKKITEIENYVIIDDDSDMLYEQRNNFVHVHQPPINYSGFSKKYLNKAIKIINK